MNDLARTGGKKLEKAVIYVRVSTEEQVENYSLETQQEICTKEAERRGLEIIEVFREEGRSAKTVSGRPELIRLLEFCRKNKKIIDAVIVYRLDRISRQTSDYLAIRKKLTECEIVLISASEPTGNSPTEKFVETMLAGFAQMDNDIRSERTTNGMRARFLTGLTNGAVPLGYLTEKGYATKDPESFHLMRKAWDRMAIGSTSLQEMADILNKQGVREKIRGKEFMLRSQTMSRIFHNKFYMGKIVSVRYAEEVQGQHEPMITEEQFYRVQAVIDGRNRSSGKPTLIKNKNNPAFPLRRIIKCSRCGAAFTAGFSKGKKARYGYYFCRKRCQSGSSIPSAQIEEQMKELLTQISPKPQTIELFIAYIRTTYKERISTLLKRREAADTDLKKLYQLRQSLVEKNLSGTYSDEIFREQNKLLEEKIRMTNLTKSDSVITKYNLEQIIKFVQNKLANLVKTYDESEIEENRMLLCSIFPSGALWSYPGYSNTPINRYYTCMLQLGDNNTPFGGPLGN